VLSSLLFRCGWPGLPQRLIDLAACPQPMQQHGQVVCVKFCKL
jgi:hypothetical protein